MRPFASFAGTTLPLNRTNVDTDAIIPKQYLKSIERSGFGDYLFDDWRYLDPGTLETDVRTRRKNPDFILNLPERQGAQILLARDNFGCGSSREYAVWALMDYGIRTVVAPSYGDIFYSNAGKNGLLLVALDDARMDELFAASEQDPAWRLEVRLEEQELRAVGDRRWNFDMSAPLKERLLNGWDEIDLTMRHAEEIRAYEARRKQQAPWLFVD